MVDCNPLCGTDWARPLKDEFAKRDWAKLMAFIDAEYSRCTVYPPINQVFRALELTWCEQTKLVILGQDPYDHDDLANGLAFSVPCGNEPPGSLKNIYKELHSDLGLKPPDHGNLLPWAHRGVLLLNTTLTVPEGGAGNPLHAKMWKPFTDAVIRVVAKESKPVFLLWGCKAHARRASIDGYTGCTVIESSHPAGRSANRPCQHAQAFIGSKQFSQADQAIGGGGIGWNLGEC